MYGTAFPVGEAVHFLRSFVIETFVCNLALFVWKEVSLCIANQKSLRI